MSSSTPSRQQARGCPTDHASVEENTQRSRKVKRGESVNGAWYQYKYRMGPVAVSSPPTPYGIVPVLAGDLE